MKKIISIIYLSFISTLVAQNVNIELISYRVPIKYSLDAQVDPDKVSSDEVYTELFEQWYRNKIGPVEYDLFIHGVYEAATTGKIKVYDPFQTEVKGTKVSFTSMSAEYVKSIGSAHDTTQIAYPYPPYDLHDTVFVAEFDINTIVAIDFLEVWTINTKTFDMKKKIIAFAPVMACYSRYNGIFEGMLPMFWVKM